MQVERAHLLCRQPLCTAVRLRRAVYARLPLRQVLRRLPEPAALGPEAVRKDLAVDVGGRAQQPRDEQMTQGVQWANPRSEESTVYVQRAPLILDLEETIGMLLKSTCLLRAMRASLIAVPIFLREGGERGWCGEYR